MQPNKFLSTLGLARRAGKVNYGFDMVVEGLDKTGVIFFAADISARSRNSVSQLAAKKDVPCRDTSFTMLDIAGAIGTKPVGIVGITEAGFTKLLMGESEKMIGGKPL